MEPHDLTIDIVNIEDVLAQFALGPDYARAFLVVVECFATAVWPFKRHSAASCGRGNSAVDAALLPCNATAPRAVVGKTNAPHASHASAHAASACVMTSRHACGALSFSRSCRRQLGHCDGRWGNIASIATGVPGRGADGAACANAVPPGMAASTDAGVLMNPKSGSHMSPTRARLPAHFELHCLHRRGTLPCRQRSSQHTAQSRRRDLCSHAAPPGWHLLDAPPGNVVPPLSAPVVPPLSAPGGAHAITLLCMSNRREI